MGEIGRMTGGGEEEYKVNVLVGSEQTRVIQYTQTRMSPASHAMTIQYS